MALSSDWDQTTQSIRLLESKMGREPLKNKPLVEAILEVRWALQAIKSQGPLPLGIFPSGVAVDGTPIVKLDPHFRLVLGRFYDRVQSEYPTHEPLPNAFLPDAVAEHSVQHRFRHKDDWPIIQLGPGILTVNDTEKYEWKDFLPRCIRAVNILFEVYPEPDTLKIVSLVLRYIDAVDFDYTQSDLGTFLKEKMDIHCGLPDTIFKDSPVRQAPETFKWNSSYNCSDPAGRITVLFATGVREQKNALVWETVFKTAGETLPDLPGGFKKWLETSHNVTDDWFFKLIEGGNGELKRRFKSDG